MVEHLTFRASNKADVIDDIHVVTSFANTFSSDRVISTVSRTVDFAKLREGVVGRTNRAYSADSIDEVVTRSTLTL